MILEWVFVNDDRVPVVEWRFVRLGDMRLTQGRELDRLAIPGWRGGKVGPTTRGWGRGDGGVDSAGKC